jgi:hypothetical protein
MRKWSEFGEQVNRLVYALAGCKFQTDIESANRFIAERIFYSEVSVRMMRQGRFRPREEQALETLVEIGKCEAELGREWANRLLRSGQHPQVELVLDKFYPVGAVGPTARADANGLPPAAGIVPRLIGGALGSFLALLLWTYAINPTYPAPHELSFLMEMVWGGLVGAGLAGGIAAADFWQNRRKHQPGWKSWPRYLALPACGMAGALLWNGAIANVFNHAAGSPVTSTGWETFSFGASYGLVFALGSLLVQKSGAALPWRFRPWSVLLLFVLVCGGLALVGYALAIIQPAFADQKDVDLFVGVMFRLGLICLEALWFPIFPLLS